MRRRLRSLLGLGFRTLLPEDPTVLGQVLRKHAERSAMFYRATEFVNYEGVEGDILEFGVFGGVSLLLLAHAHRCDTKGMTRRIVGFDSFRGLPSGEESHARWKPGDCSGMHGWHPLLRPGEPVRKETTLELFRRCEMPLPEIEEGSFAETVSATIPSKYRAVALVHIDCDLYESAKQVLEGVEPILQDGTVVLFDDWFSYRGHPLRGESRAFHEFLEEHPCWGARHYQTYGSFSDSFILYRK